MSLCEGGRLPADTASSGGKSEVTGVTVPPVATLHCTDAAPEYAAILSGHYISTRRPSAFLEYSFIQSKSREGEKIKNNKSSCFERFLCQFLRDVANYTDIIKKQFIKRTQL